MPPGLFAVADAAPAPIDVAHLAAHGELEVIGVAALTSSTVDTSPNMSVRSSRSISGNGCQRLIGERASQVVLIPLRACALRPLYATKVAELVATSASRQVSNRHTRNQVTLRHMKAALVELDHVLALCALLPHATPSNVHEELNMRIARA